MKLEEFKYMEKESKKQLLFDNGTYLCSRNEPDYLIELYQIDSFYVEVFYTNHKKTIIYLRAFSNFSDLDPYLVQIKLPDL